MQSLPAALPVRVDADGRNRWLGAPGRQSDHGVVLRVGRGPHKTVHYAKGYDNRTPTSGEGTIQLVSPTLTRWLQPGANFETGGIGILRIKFIPEPQSWAMLVAGVCALVVLRGASRRI